MKNFFEKNKKKLTVFRKKSENLKIIMPLEKMIEINYFVMLIYDLFAISIKIFGSGPLSFHLFHRSAFFSFFNYYKTIKCSARLFESLVRSHVHRKKNDALS